MKKIEVKIPLYGGKLVIIQCENWDYIKDKYKYALEKYSNQPDERHDGYVFENNLSYGDTQYIVAFKDTPKGSVIAHECVHLVNSVYANCVISIDIYNDEHQAYLLEWFFDQIDTFFSEKKVCVEHQPLKDCENRSTTFTLQYKDKNWPLKFGQSVRGIRHENNRPNWIIIDCYEVADVDKLDKLIDYLYTLRLTMQ